VKSNGAEARKLVDLLGCPSVAALDRELARLDRIRAYRRLAATIAVCFAAVAALVIIATNTWVAVMQVNGSSMNPLLKMNETVFAVRGADCGQNDIIAFYINSKLYIKRVVAVAGDTVDIDADGTVSVNGEVLDEPYIAEPSLGSCDIKLPYMVPAGTVFVLGDNREQATDSRDSRFGPISGEQIVGRVVLGLWPLKRLG